MGTLRQWTGARPKKRTETAAKSRCRASGRVTEYPVAIVSPPFIPGLEADLWFQGETLDR